MTTTAERPWVQEMIVVHRVFRRESGYLPELVAACRPGDTARAALLAGLIREYVEGLHQHHTAEDELLWPKLLGRLDPCSARCWRRRPRPRQPASCRYCHCRPG